MCTAAVARGGKMTEVCRMGLHPQEQECRFVFGVDKAGAKTCSVWMRKEGSSEVPSCTAAQHS